METRVLLPRWSKWKLQRESAFLILLEHKSIDYLDHFKSYMWTKMYMCIHVSMFTYTCTYGQKYIHMCKNMTIFIYVCKWTHLLCLCQQMHQGTCAYVNVDMCINIACVTHMLLCEYLRLYVFICMCTYAYTYLMHTHTSMPAFMCFNMSNLHIYICYYINIHMDKHIRVYTHVLFMCICDNISFPKHVHICMYIPMHVPYPCTHVLHKNVSIYAHLNIFIWTKISFNTYLTHRTKLIK